MDWILKKIKKYCMSIFCIGRNYVEHAHELGNEVPTSAIIFMKPDTALLAAGENFSIPSFTNDLHFEGELVLRVSKKGKNLSEAHPNGIPVIEYCDAISVGIDFTARDLQNKLKKDSLPWEKSKSFDGSALIGNWINKKNIDDLNNLDFSLTKNGDIVQKGNTSKMLWKIDKLISEISKFFTLKIGDIIFTGTPSGVGRVNENDNLVGYINEKECFSIKIK